MKLTKQKVSEVAFQAKTEFSKLVEDAGPNFDYDNIDALRQIYIMAYVKGWLKSFSEIITLIKENGIFWFRTMGLEEDCKNLSEKDLNKIIGELKNVEKPGKTGKVISIKDFIKED